MKKFFGLGLILTVSAFGGNSFAVGESASFKVQSDQFVASGAHAESDSFKVQTKSITFSSKGKSNNFNIKQVSNTSSGSTGNTNAGQFWFGLAAVFTVVIIS